MIPSVQTDAELLRELEIRLAGLFLDKVIATNEEFNDKLKASLALVRELQRRLGGVNTTRKDSP